MPGPPNGDYTQSDDDGIVRQQAHFVDGKPHGPLRIFGPGGVLAIEENYVAGALHGTRRMYTAGLLLSEAEYKDGLQEGPATLFHPVEQKLPAMKMNFLHGLQHGETTCYDNAGKLTQRKHFVSGVAQGDAVSYYPDTGKTLSIEPYDRGLQHGEATWFAPEGEWLRKIVYDRGKRLSVRSAAAPPGPTPVQTLLHSLRKKSK